jgi:hypothetical protein
MWNHNKSFLCENTRRKKFETLNFNFFLPMQFHLFFKIYVTFDIIPQFVLELFEHCKLL